MELVMEPMTEQSCNCLTTTRTTWSLSRRTTKAHPRRGRALHRTRTTGRAACQSRVGGAQLRRDVSVISSLLGGLDRARAAHFCLFRALPQGLCRSGLGPKARLNFVLSLECGAHPNVSWWDMNPPPCEPDL